MKDSDIRKEAIKNLQGTELKGFSLDNKDISLLSGWTYLGMLLMEAKVSLEHSRKLNEKEKFTTVEEFTLAHGMFKNAIMSYAKCFASSGNGRISLDSVAIFAKRSDLKLSHDKMLEARNKYIAHNDENDFDISLIVTDENKHDVTLAQTYTAITPLSNFDQFLETIEYCQEQVIITFNKKIDKIQLRIGKEIKFK